MYALKKDVVKLAHHRLEKSSKGGGEEGKIGSRIEASELDLVSNHKKNLTSAENVVIGGNYGTSPEQEHNILEEDPDFCLQDFGSDSEGSEDDLEYDKKEEELLADLKKLKNEAAQDEVSKAIFNNIDPRIKRVLFKSTGFALDSSSLREKADSEIIEIRPVEVSKEATPGEFSKSKLNKQSKKRISAVVDEQPV